jgi:hypothetical protein
MLKCFKDLPHKVHLFKSNIALIYFQLGMKSSNWKSKILIVLCKDHYYHRLKCTGIDEYD